MKKIDFLTLHENNTPGGNKHVERVERLLDKLRDPLTEHTDEGWGPTMRKGVIRVGGEDVYIDWMVQKNPDAIDGSRYGLDPWREESLLLRTSDWDKTAGVKFKRNLFWLGVINMDVHASSEPSVASSEIASARLSVVDPERQTDELNAYNDYCWGRASLSRAINGAPAHAESAQEEGTLKRVGIEQPTDAEIATFGIPAKMFHDTVRTLLRVG